MKRLLLLFLVQSACFGQPLSDASAPFLLSTSSLRKGLAGYWRMEEASGTRYDCSSNGNHLTPTNAVGQVAGIVGHAASFDAASSQCLGIADKTSLRQTTNGFTIAAWVKFTTKTSPPKGIVCKEASAGAREYTLFYDTANKFFASYWYNGFSVLKGFAEASTFGEVATNTWYFVCTWINDKTCYIQVNNGATNSNTITDALGTTTGEFTVGFQPSGVNRYFNGEIDEVGVWRRVLTEAERTQLFNNTNGVTFPRFKPVTISGPIIYNPVPWQVFQRDTLASGHIDISGNVGSGTHSIEASFNGGAWVTIASGVSGDFSGTLASQTPGQGILEVRATDLTNAIDRVYPVGIGEVFVLGGQSNTSGHGTNYQNWTNVTITPSIFGNNYQWRRLSDPTDSDSGQVDLVSDDAYWFGVAPTGSTWPLLATQIMADQNVPVAFVPCAIGSSSIISWLQSGSATNRASLFGSMAYRGKYAISGARCVLWWQGEHEVGVEDQPTYYNHLTNFSNQFYTATGLKTMPCKLEILGTDNSDVNNAIAQAWTNSNNTCVTGPDLSGILPDNYPTSAHITSDSGLLAVATLWFGAIKAAYFP